MDRVSGLLERARLQTALDDFGEQSFREGLEVLVASGDQEARLTDFGRAAFEAQIVDRKSYDVEEPYRGHRPAGAHVHDMQVRLTLDRQMVVRGIEVTTNHAPYDVCPSVAPGYQALVGAKAGGGWRKEVTEAVGRTKGCTHITELLMATILSIIAC